jgi:hypothetical protein
VSSWPLMLGVRTMCVCKVVRLMSLSCWTPNRSRGTWSSQGLCSRFCVITAGCCSRSRCSWTCSRRAGVGRRSRSTSPRRSLVLQALFGLSDREAMRAVRTDLQWKVACGLPIGHAGFDASVLTYWRRRLLAPDAPNRIFDAVREVIAQTAAVKGKTRRALDSTVFDDAVATQDTVTQLIALIRKVRRDIPAVVEMVGRVCSAHDYDDPGKPQIAWDDSEAREQLVSALVNDALALLAELDSLELDAEQSRTIALLALLAGQDVEPAEDSDGSDGRGGSRGRSRRTV